MKYYDLIKRVITFFVIIVSLDSASLIAKTLSPEHELIISMKLNKATRSRIGDSGKAIQSYIKKGYLRKKPNLRFDYVDYWVLTRSTKFLGHRLMVIEEEYMSKYVGCCVSPGVGAILKIHGNMSSLKRFARKNGCSINAKSDVRKILRDFKVNLNKRSKYVSLSCRERDIPTDFFIATNDKEYAVEYNSHGVILSPVVGKAKIYLGKKCDAFSKSYGKGVWSTNYSGIVIQFGKKTIRFAGQEFEIEGSKGC